MNRWSVPAGRRAAGVPRPRGDEPKFSIINPMLQPRSPPTRRRPDAAAPVSVKDGPVLEPRGEIQSDFLLGCCACSRRRSWVGGLASARLHRQRQRARPGPARRLRDHARPRHPGLSRQGQRDPGSVRQDRVGNLSRTFRQAPLRRWMAAALDAILAALHHHVGTPKTPDERDMLRPAICTQTDDAGTMTVRFHAVCQDRHDCLPARSRGGRQAPFRSGHEERRPDGGGRSAPLHRRGVGRGLFRPLGDSRAHHRA